MNDANVYFVILGGLNTNDICMEVRIILVNMESKYEIFYVTAQNSFIELYYPMDYVLVYFVHFNRDIKVHSTMFKVILSYETFIIMANIP